MGCVNDSGLTPEEEILKENEHALGFYLQPPSEVDLSVRKFSSEFFLSQKQMDRFAKSASITVKKEGHIGKFWEQYNSEQGYLRNSVLVLGIMLSTGKPNDKASLLFDIANPLSKPRALKTDISWLLTEMMLTATVRQEPLLSPEQLSEVPALPAYLADLKVRMAASFEVFQAEILSSAQLSKRRFVTLLANEDFRYIVNADGMRAYIASHARKKPEETAA